ncbi:flagellar hook-length control protein FliK [Paeniglutamicibacter sp. NPDC012692]|uniref:flagellar hook-length control protein FliK n=1 Tax=Paeniglutamicibacter sp. NPDC012692 TaxID=3364388 RepID=UPI003693DB60
MIPLLLGAQPAQNTAQPTKAGSGDSANAFEDLLASILPAGQDTASALDDTVAEPETAEHDAAGTGGGVFVDQQIQARLTVPMPGIVPVEAETPTIVDPATSVKLGAAAPGESDIPPFLLEAPDLGTPAPAIPPVAVSSADATAGSTEAAVTNPGVMSLAGGVAPDTQANTGGNGKQAADEVEAPATVSVDETPVDAQGPAVELEALPAGPASEGTPSPVAPSPGFQVPVSHNAAPAPRPEALLGLGAVSGGRTIAVENVVSREPQAPPINRQLVGPIASLASGPHGERTLSVNIAPEALGPVTVKAHLGHEGLRVELTAPTEAGREALRAMLPELRRDLAATGAGTVSIGTATDAGNGAGTYSGGGQASMANDQRFGGGAATAAVPGRQQGEETSQLPAQEARPSAHASSHLDVMA